MDRVKGWRWWAQAAVAAGGGAGLSLQPVQQDGDRWRPLVGHSESQFSPAGPMGKIRLPHTCKPYKRPWNGMLLLRRRHYSGMKDVEWWVGGGEGSWEKDGRRR
ncbi:hypothetical protein WMY93_026701 [Mugilogobius chulae]|uniref:Uncharacterized protein n=1 Tax=Mugilogobius chulae TaxID=88201 RepID=A0AAW0N3Y4_9GOBI